MVYWNCFKVEWGSKFRIPNPELASHRQCHSSFTVLQSFLIYREFDVKIFKISRTIGTVPKMLTKNIFLTRLFSYFHNLSKNQLGLISDIMSIQQSYDFNVHVWTLLDDGFFTKNLPGVKIVRDKVPHVSNRRTRMSHDCDFTLFTKLYIN